MGGDLLGGGDLAAVVLAGGVFHLARGCGRDLAARLDRDPLCRTDGGFLLWNAAMAMAGISRIGQIGLLQPVFVALIAAAFAREPLDPITMMFVGAVVATVAIGTRLRVKRSPGPA